MVERNFPSTHRSKIVPCKWWWLLILQIHPDILFFLILNTLSLLSAQCGFPLGGKNNFKQSRVSVITSDCSLRTSLWMRGRWQRSVKSKRHGNDKQLFSVFSKTRARGHQMEHGGDGFKTNKGKWFFIQCIIKPWNSLPQDVVDAVNLHGFKKDWTSSWKKNSSRAIKYKDITSGSGRCCNANLKMLWECSEEISLCHFTFPQACINSWPLSERGTCVRWIPAQLIQLFLCPCFTQLSYSGSRSSDGHTMLFTLNTPSPIRPVSNLKMGVLLNTFNFRYFIFPIFCLEGGGNWSFLADSGAEVTVGSIDPSPLHIPVGDMGRLV